MYESTTSRPMNRGNYGSSGRGGAASMRGYENGRPHSPNGLPSPTFSPAASLNGYAPLPMYASPDFNQGAFQPYPYMPFMPYGYPAVGPNGQYMPYDPNAALGMSQRPMPSNPHLLYDPPMDEASFWVLGQIEYYLSQDNLARDPFLRENVGRILVLEASKRIS
jgi:la-related protein 1